MGLAFLSCSFETVSLLDHTEPYFSLVTIGIVAKCERLAILRLNSCVYSSQKKVHLGEILRTSLDQC
jgi:hypothetical protein